MTASARSVRFWLVRILPLAAAALLVAILVPADFNAAANTVTGPAAATVPVRAAQNLPAPPVIPAGTLKMSGPASSISTEPAPTQVAEITPPPPVPALPATLSTGAMPPTPPAVRTDASKARIAYSGVNVRAAADKGAQKLFVLPPGASVDVAESINGWMHVYTDQGSGWVYKTYLLGGDASSQSTVQMMSPKPKPAKSPLIGRTVEVASNVTVHDGPSSDSDSIYSLDPGERVQIVEASGQWARIATADGESGWVRLR